MEDKPPGLELQNSFGALGETDSEQEIPLASFDDFSVDIMPDRVRKEVCTQRWKIQYTVSEAEEGSANEVQK